MQIIVTDLTRFKNNELLCLAGLTEDGKTCIRPLRTTAPGYLTFEQCKKHNILPGTILEADFVKPETLEAPHIEDRHFSNLRMKGTVSSKAFQDVLAASSKTSISEAFRVDVKSGQKVLTTTPAQSIVTLRVNPRNFDLVNDDYDPDKVKAHLQDEKGVELSYLPITDLGFYDNVGRIATRKTTARDISRFIHNQDQLYIRLGLSRRWQSPDGRAGFWMQVNGIYTFPDYKQVVRTY